MNAELLAVTDQQYHEDPCDTPSLSATCAHTLLSRSPFHAWLEHPKLGGKRRKATRAMGTGTLFHSFVLGETSGAIVVVDAADYKTKAAQQAKADAVEQGKTPILIAEYQDAQIGASKIREKLARRGILLDGTSEVKIKWHHGPVACRAALDHVLEAKVFDLKITNSADPETIRKHIIAYGYDVQEAVYTEALAALRPELEGRVQFRFIFAEPEPPYCVTVVRTDASLRRLGGMKWERACRLWRRCLDSDQWPEYEEGELVVSAKPWDIEREESAA